MSDNGLELAIGGTALGAVCTLVGSWIKARYGKVATVPQPLEVKHHERFADKQSNDESHCNIFARLSEHDKKIATLEAITSTTERRLDRIEDKLDEILKCITIK